MTCCSLLAQFVTPSVIYALLLLVGDLFVLDSLRKCGLFLPFRQCSIERKEKRTATIAYAICMRISFVMVSLNKSFRSMERPRVINAIATFLSFISFTCSCFIFLCFKCENSRTILFYSVRNCFVTNAF